MLTITKSIISLFLIMLVGIYASKKEIITPKINRDLINILLKIILPIMIISSFAFSYNDTIKSNVVKTFYYSFITYVIIIIISYILTMPIERDKRTILHFANVFTNTGYIGFPILDVVYGSEAVIYGSVFNMFFVIFLWTYGIMVFKGKMERKELKREVVKTLLNPAVIAVYFGVTIMTFDIQLPDVIISSIDSIGNMTAPLSMVIVGAMISNVNIKNYLKDWTIYYGIIIKIILIPAILYIISVPLNDNSMVINSIIILASMPSAAMVPIFAENFNVLKEYATIIMVVTTFLSIFSLPVLLNIII
ncbi:AEC family transporter [Schnuerera sp. xch1]|uniref:AEC family transporter n=1 Tax=Schnuerera sp. xch1 TaxID=2874283 RepID=UPI001CBB2CF7|nr:AEC family transporter [Schnuerera sp. xch1]